MKEDIYGKAAIRCLRCGKEYKEYKEYDVKLSPGRLGPVSYQKYEEDVWVYILGKGYLCPYCYKKEELDKLSKTR
jgi:DNA-directed RNA polymerase subunit RPC12/RpoP